MNKYYDLIMDDLTADKEVSAIAKELTETINQAAKDYLQKKKEAELTSKINKVMVKIISSIRDYATLKEYKTEVTDADITYTIDHLLQHGRCKCNNNTSPSNDIIKEFLIKNNL